MAHRRQVRVVGEEVALHVAEQVDPRIDPALADLGRRGQVLDAEGAVGGVWCLLDDNAASFADDQRRVPRAEEPGAVSALVEDAEGGDADKVRQFRPVVAELLGHQ